MKNLMKLKGAKTLNKNEQKKINGGFHGLGCYCPCYPGHCNVPLGPYKDCWYCVL